MIIDFRARPPFRESESEPYIKAPLFMNRYSDLMEYEKKVNVPLTTLIPQLISEMDEAGITIVVLQAEYEFGDMSVKLNNTVSNLVQQYPSRFIGFATVDPRKGMDAVRELEYAVKTLGLKGLNLQPCFINMNPIEPLFYPLYAKCVELNIPVTLHTGINYSTTHSVGPDRPIHLDRIACDFPELKIVANHGGWPWVQEMVAIAMKHPNIYIDFGSVGPKYIAMARAGWDPMFHFMNSLLQDQVLFSTDWPFISFKRVLKEFSEIGLKETVMEKFFYKNAAKLLQIDP